MIRFASLALVCAILAGCGAATPSAPASVATSPAASVAPSVARATPTATLTATPAPSATPVPGLSLKLVAVHLVGAIDEAEQISADDDASLVTWFSDETTWADANVSQAVAGSPPVGAYLEGLRHVAEALGGGFNPAPSMAEISATRDALATIAGLGAKTPAPTPVPVKPIVFKGKGRTNTRPFTVAGGDYTAVITGTGNGNVIAHLTLRDKSDYEPLFNEIVHGKYRYELIVYAVEPGSYFFEMEVDGTWTISLTPFTG